MTVRVEQQQAVRAASVVGASVFYTSTRYEYINHEVLSHEYEVRVRQYLSKKNLLNKIPVGGRLSTGSLRWEKPYLRGLVHKAVRLFFRIICLWILSLED